MTIGGFLLILKFFIKFVVMRVLLILFMSLLCAELYAQSSQATVVKPPQSALTLRESLYDFGKIQQGRPVTHEFEVTNQGPDLLKIENVQASCGCTTPTWQKTPVAPHKSTRIGVGFNAAADGPFEKTITILYNGGQTKTLTIKGNVYKSPATSAPLNASIELLKQIN
jgi:hypothetical protein